MKVLKDNQFAELQAKADSFDAIVNAIIENGEDISPADVSAETIIQTLTGNTPEEGSSADLQASLDTANTKITELEGSLNTANSRIEELEEDLDDSPAEPPAVITSRKEPSGEKSDIVDFAIKNADNPFEVIAEAEKQGLL